MAKKSSLGRGLGAILEDVELAYKAELSGGNRDIITEIDVNLITENPYQPRKHFDESALRELSESIKRHGLIQPIIVIQKDDGYMLIAGERRFRATKMLGEGKIKAIVADIESKNLRELALIENIQREDLNPIELANSYKELIDEYKITQEGLAGIIHKSRTQITNTMRLLSLSKQTQEFIKDGKITQGHAKVIVGLEPNDEKMAVDTIIGQRLSVRETENLVKNLKDKSKTSSNNSLKIDESYIKRLDDLKNLLEKFHIKSKIKNKNLILEFKEISDIENFIGKIS
ncbi:ParB/RepB/Spo0J family partition protein [Campylobacter sp.]|uniref:ParB/RepB/Spo0J family partition protein n=1 Tax=Campylobacter sp. TaxID=205 RepID=UPI0026FD59E8|nr:ParB/RepB/Spo0J family partition protein [Campylobacter sp.]